MKINKKQFLQFMNWWAFSFFLTVMTYYGIQILKHYNFW